MCPDESHVRAVLLALFSAISPCRSSDGGCLGVLGLGAEAGLGRLPAAAPQLHKRVRTGVLLLSNQDLLSHLQLTSLAPCANYHMEFKHQSRFWQNILVLT